MVQKKIKTIVWSKNAEKQYYEILNHLLEEAPQAIDKVGNALLDTIDDLALHFNHYPSDRFKRNNDGTYKAALVFSYRISYQIGGTTVNILRIRHTSKEPLDF